MNSLYQSNVYFSAWQADNGSTLTPIVDDRESDFGAQLLVEFKQFARITYTNDDNILPEFIDSTIRTVEQILEFCIFPRSFEWNVADEYQDYEKFEVPLRNTKAVGAIYDFTPERAAVIIEKPSAFPVELVCGYDSAADLPVDLKMAIFQLATAHERNRMAADSLPVSNHILSRYGIMRC
jgi:hypothetical protein